MVSRREVILGGAVAGSAALAGCSALPGFGDGDDGYELEDFSEYSQWLGAREAGPVTLFAANPADIVDFDALGDGGGGDGDGGGGDGDGGEENDGAGDGIFGVPTARVAHLVDVSVGEAFEGFDHSALVAVGDYEPDAAREGFEAEQSVGTTAEGTYGDFDVYAVDQADGDAEYSLFAVRDQVALAASDRETFESLADAESGDGDRLVDKHAAFGRAVDVIGNQDWNQYSVRFPEETAHNRLVRGTGFEFSADRSRFTEVSVYRSAADAASDESAIRDYWENTEEGTDDVEVDVDGRVLTVTGSQDNDQIF